MTRPGREASTRAEGLVECVAAQRVQGANGITEVEMATFRAVVDRPRRQPRLVRIAAHGEADQ